MYKTNRMKQPSVSHAEETTEEEAGRSSRSRVRTQRTEHRISQKKNYFMFRRMKIINS